MTTITKALEKDAGLLTALATKTFTESHGHSADSKDIDAYIIKTYPIEALAKNCGMKIIFTILSITIKGPRAFPKSFSTSPMPAARCKISPSWSACIY